MLEHYRVLDLTDDRGHLAGLMLAQLGADVIAVEPPGGQRARWQGPWAPSGADPERSLTHWAYNRGKRSVVVGDAVDLERLAAGADALIESGAVDLDLGGLRQRHPHLVTASISAFGRTGPKAGWAATDLIANAASGTLGITGDRDRPPVRLSLPQSFHFAALDAACAVLLALAERARSGLGQHADLAAQHSYISANQYQMLYPLVGQEGTKRLSGGAQVGNLMLRLVYDAADGWVTAIFLFGAMFGPYTRRLFAWMEEEGACPEELRDFDWAGFGLALSSDPDAPRLLDLGAEALNRFLSTKTKAELQQAALDRHVLIAPINTTRELLNLPQLAFRRYWEQVDGVRFPGPPAHPTAAPLPVPSRPPRLGEHTAEVLAETPRRPAVPDRPPTDRPVTAGDERCLEGVKVLDFTWAIAGPYATRILADHGACVIRVESELRPDVLRGAGPFVNGEIGQENSLSHYTPNASKLGLALDLQAPEARDVCFDLVRWADIVIEAFSPGVIERLGLGYEAVRAANPEAIMLSTCLMGQTGPLRSASGFGNMGAAVAGFYPIGGWPDRPPSGPFGAYSDYISPRFTVAVLLAALEHRRRTGVGQFIDFSQMESAIHLLAPAILADEVLGVEGSRHGNTDPEMAPHGVYPLVGDDRWLALACETDEQWRALATVIGRAELAGLGRAERITRREELDGAVAAWSSTQDGETAEGRLQGLGVAAHRVLYAAEVVADPQLSHRRAFVQVPHPNWGEVWVEDTPIRLSRTPGGARWAGPTFGQHLLEILTELLDHDADSAADLVATGVFR